MKSFIANGNNESIFCKISQDNGATWIHGIIVNFSESTNTLCIFLSSKNFYKYFGKDKQLVIKALDNTHENIYIGTIEQSRLNRKPNLIKVNIIDTLSFYNNRRFERFLVNYTATIEDSLGNCFRTKIHDMSISGLSFYSQKKLRNHSYITITINTSYRTKLCLFGNIIGREFCDNQFRYSVQTTPLDACDDDILIQIMYGLLLSKNNICEKYTLYSMIRNLCLYGSYFLIAIALIYLCSLFYAY